MKLFKLSYSLVSYLLFLGVFTYFIVFMAGDALAILVPGLAGLKSVDSGIVALVIPGLPAGLSNVVLLLVFSLQHSIMARLGFKRLITRLVPESAERSTYVLATCLVLAWLYLAWQPMPTVVWQVEGGVVYPIFLLFLMGAGLVLWSTFMISHWQLFGLAQAWQEFRGIEPQGQPFIEPAAYKYTRHPLYLGLLIVLWATPSMTVGHMLIASLLSIYIFIGIGYEERDLLRQFGQEYRDYMDRVPQLLPFGRKKL
ncbi:isoprenylcysteine carboxylmethyltransferase family protein [Marinobacter salinisoli]|uniref:Isoprenylcysteine carboxylmethyltransferase family protein n=1 Tax=Marinobacter salinisoli TaxID=2769486 RepID=A0ABX7MRG8_9GAMM|nr:isoprenylcysteine carboxylmethyltransferase family protein [Marinobacter salinisoli]QSP94891.1 isoprenylcysteine carboxylmethyltransferase family protein [Marinobacter salinisoli]